MVLAIVLLLSYLSYDYVLLIPGQGEISMVILPSAFYMQLPKSAGLPTGKKWLKIDGSGSDPASRAFGPLLDQMRQSFDPEANLQLLGAATSVEAAGTDEIDGVETTRYDATVDLAKAAKTIKGPA